MAVSVCVCCLSPIAVSRRAAILALLQNESLVVDEISSDATLSGGFCVALVEQADDATFDRIAWLASRATVLVLAVGGKQTDARTIWRALGAGARDIICWPELPVSARDIACRLERWQTVRELVDSDVVRSRVAGRSMAWRSMLHDVVDVARHTQASVMITGETGTGKEQVARLIHELDARQPAGEFIVVDCTTLSGDLAGSEFFGHERGAFTGAASGREGAFALAHGGTLFLDEVGELGLELQAKLLRVVQERQYKPLGSNHWQHSQFRLICATHRDLDDAMAKGMFRADLFYRISGLRCMMPPLRDRTDDILPLCRFILGQLDPDAANMTMDPAVLDYLQTRPYPGNVRDLRQTIARLWQRHSGAGPLTAGDIPEHDRPPDCRLRSARSEDDLAGAIRRAVEQGMGLKEIGQVVADLATRAALELEAGSLQRAAARLGVTDRALQIRRANRRAVQPPD